MGAYEEIKARVENDGVEFIYAMFVEMHGKPCAKLVPVEALETVMNEGAGFAGFAAGPIGQDPSSPDILAIPCRSEHGGKCHSPEVDDQVSSGLPTKYSGASDQGLLIVLIWAADSRHSRESGNPGLSASDLCLDAKGLWVPAPDRAGGDVLSRE